MAQFGKVGVLYGGKSAERDVSIKSGTGVHRALRAAGVDAHLFDTGARSLAQLVAERFDRVFIALHGRYGEDGTLQGALELLQLPYTGSGPLASALAMDKVMTKRIWLANGLPTPRFAVLDAHATPREQLRTVPDELGLPLMLKAPHEGSTIGIAKVNGYSDMQAGFDLCARYDDVVLAEEFIRGRELTVPVIGTGRAARALPVIEIRAPEGNYDYQHKYFTDDTKYLCPAPLDEALTRHVQELAVRAFHALGCRGWSRVDFMLRESQDGAAQAEPFLLEINTSPGMTGHSLVPMAAKAIGMSYEDLCCEILQLAALDMTPSKDWAPQASGR